MEQWTKSTDTELFKKLQEVTKLFNDAVNAYLQDEKNKVERILALQEELIGTSDRQHNPE